MTTDYIDVIERQSAVIAGQKEIIQKYQVLVAEYKEMVQILKDRIDNQDLYV